MVYYLTACITSLSAFLGLAFSIYAIKNSDNQEKTNALYMFARSMAIYIKNRMRTVGPSIMAVLHAICLLI